MRLKGVGCVLVCSLFIYLVMDIIECKRGGGRRGGTYRGSSSVWGRNKQSSSGYDPHGRRGGKQQPQPEVPEMYKPSAPPAQPANPKKASSDFLNSERGGAVAPAPATNQNKKISSEFIQKESSPLNANAPKGPSAGSSSSDFLQHERNPHQTVGKDRPVGWDVGGNKKVEDGVAKSTGWNVGSGQTHHVPPPYTANGYGSNPSQSGGYPNYGAGAQGYSYGQAPPAYTGYQQNHQPQHLGPPPQYTPGNYYHQQGAPPSYSMGQPNYGGGYNNHGGYGGGMGGMGSYYGGNNNYNGKYGGGFGSGLGGFGGGYGGFGGYGHGMGGYGSKFGGGFGSGFGSHAVRNVLVGMLVWHVVSGLTRRPYYVYNYYNNPEKVPQEIPVQANSIVLCSDNVTSLCAPNTAPLCTGDNKILCVVLAQQTVPCGDNSTMKCATSTVTCGADDKDCDTTKTEAEKKKSTINIPCVTNATIVGKMLDNTTITYSGTGTLLKPDSATDTTTLCVTALALPQPEEEAKLNDVTCEPGTTVSINGTTVPCPTISTTTSTVPTPTASSSTENPKDA